MGLRLNRLLELDQERAGAAERLEWARNGGASIQCYPGLVFSSPEQTLWPHQQEENHKSEGDDFPHAAPECDGCYRLQDAEDDASGKGAEGIAQPSQHHRGEAVEGEGQADAVRSVLHRRDTAVTAPFCTSKDTSSMARIPPKNFESPSMRRMA
jgi:hypothetical protein